MKVKRQSDGVMIELEGQWSEVKEEEWEDVTRECNLLCEGKVLQHANNSRFVGAVESGGYRLCKRLVSDLLEHEDQQYTKYVFIVERKKP